MPKQSSQAHLAAQSSLFNEQDHGYMQKAIDLAWLGRFTTSPNPNVGCIIVKHQQIIGTGYHRKAGDAHAEVNALNMAGAQAHGATVYVTLEPCSHFGRTPPCANALIKAGVSRVVIAMQDPNPAVAGHGIQNLQEANITVAVGLLTEQAEQLNKGFFKRMRTGRPYVQLKLAASLDGKIAMASGESKWITCPLARQDVQLFRAQASAILTTCSTILADNPSLTVRWAELPLEAQHSYPQDNLRQPVRVIIDSQNLLTGAENIFTQTGENWLVRKQDLPIANSTLIIDSSTAKHIDLLALLTLLGEKQINNLWVEAGSHLAGALIEQDLVDELIIYMAPKLLGHNAQDLVHLPHLQQLSQAPEFILQSMTMMGDDIRLILTKK